MESRRYSDGGKQPEKDTSMAGVFRRRLGRGDGNVCSYDQNPEIANEIRPTTGILVVFSCANISFGKAVLSFVTPKSNMTCRLP